MDLSYGELALQSQRVVRPLRVRLVSSHVEAERTDLVHLQLTALGLQPGRDVGRQCPVLTLDGPHLDLQPGGVGLTPVRRQQEVAFLGLKINAIKTI